MKEWKAAAPPSGFGRIDDYATAKPTNLPELRA